MKINYFLIVVLTVFGLSNHQAFAHSPAATVGFVRQNTAIYVPSITNRLCPKQPIQTIQDALNCLSHYKISPKATVSIIMIKQPSAAYQTVYVNHPDGNRIGIIGDCKNNGDANNACMLHFRAGQNGLIVQNGNKLGLFENFSLHGRGASANNLISGISAMNNGAIILGQHIEVESFWNGIWATNHSYIFAQHNTVKNNAFIGIAAYQHSIIDARYAIIKNNGKISTHAQSHSQVKLDSSTAPAAASHSADKENNAVISAAAKVFILTAVSQAINAMQRDSDDSN